MWGPLGFLYGQSCLSWVKHGYCHAEILLLMLAMPQNFSSGAPTDCPANFSLLASSPYRHVRLNSPYYAGAVPLDAEIVVRDHVCRQRRVHIAFVPVIP